MFDPPPRYRIRSTDSSSRCGPGSRFAKATMRGSPPSSGSSSTSAQGKRRRCGLVEEADGELAFAGPLRLEPGLRDDGQFWQHGRDVGRLQDAEAQPIALGPAEDLAVHLAGRAVERDAVEVDVRLLAELEEDVAAVVQRRNPLERDLIEDRRAIELAGEREEGVQEIAPLAGGAHGGIGEHREVRPGRPVQADAALIVEERCLVAVGHHQERRVVADARVQARAPDRRPAR